MTVGFKIVNLKKRDRTSITRGTEENLGPPDPNSKSHAPRTSLSSTLTYLISPNSTLQIPKPHIMASRYHSSTNVSNSFIHFFSQSKRSFTLSTTTSFSSVSEKSGSRRSFSRQASPDPRS